jgi:hypothetical protein
MALISSALGEGVDFAGRVPGFGGEVEQAIGDLVVA